MPLRGIVLGGAIVVVAAIFAAEIPKLPPPYATPSANNPPRVIPEPAGARLTVPPGFHMEIWAEGFARPRYMLLGPSGELLLSDAADAPDGAIYAMPLNQADGYKAHDRKKLIGGLDRPYGLAFWHEYLYVGEPESIKRYKYDARSMTAGPGTSSHCCAVTSR